jgi:hypothetical protein
VKRRTKVFLTVIVGAIFAFAALFAFLAWFSAHHVGHGRPYRWDAYVLPEECFSNTPVSEIVARVNALVAKTATAL